MGQQLTHGHIVNVQRPIRDGVPCVGPHWDEELHLEARERIGHHVTCVFEEMKGFKVEPVQYNQLRPSWDFIWALLKTWQRCPTLSGKKGFSGYPSYDTGFPRVLQEFTRLEADSDLLPALVEACKALVRETYEALASLTWLLHQGHPTEPLKVYSQLQ